MKKHLKLQKHLSRVTGSRFDKSMNKIDFSKLEGRGGIFKNGDWYGLPLRPLT